MKSLRSNLIGTATMTLITAALASACSSSNEKSNRIPSGVISETGSPAPEDLRLLQRAVGILTRFSLDTYAEHEFTRLIHQVAASRGEDASERRAYTEASKDLSTTILRQTLQLKRRAGAAISDDERARAEEAGILMSNEEMMDLASHLDALESAGATISKNGELDLSRSKISLDSISKRTRLREALELFTLPFSAGKLADPKRREAVQVGNSVVLPPLAGKPSSEPLRAMSHSAYKAEIEKSLREFNDELEESMRSSRAPHLIAMSLTVRVNQLAEMGIPEEMKQDLLAVAAVFKR